MEVIGYKRVRFTPKDKDDEICGYNIYVSYEAEDIVGLGSERIFVSDAKLDNYVPIVGDALDVVYNRYGRVDRVLVS